MKIRTKTGLRVFTYTDIKGWGACYDPVQWIPVDWSGTAVDILRMNQIGLGDRLRCVLRTSLTCEKLMRLFAVWCARQVQHLMIDKRSLDALDVAERFAHGKATDEERDAAWDAARDAQRDKLIEMFLAEGLQRIKNKKGKK